jgi:hypothetical protein
MDENSYCIINSGFPGKKLSLPEHHSIIIDLMVVPSMIYDHYHTIAHVLQGGCRVRGAGSAERFLLL